MTGILVTRFWQSCYKFQSRHGLVWQRRRSPVRLARQPRAHRRFLIAFSTLCLLLGSSLASAADTGRVSGKVIDPQGASVAGARVQLVNAAGAVVREVKSDGQGNFVLAGIDPGEYQISAQA